MSYIDIIRAWKDEEYRLSLSDAQRAQLPESPVGLVELTDAEMSTLAGGMGYAKTCDPYDPYCKGYTPEPKKNNGSNGMGVAKGCVGKGGRYDDRHNYGY